MKLLITKYPHLHQISTSAPYSQNAYPAFSPLILETKFHTHINLQATLFSIVGWVCFLIAEWNAKYSCPNDSRRSIKSTRS